MLTLFNWGYKGWGNAIPQLLETTELLEKSRGYKAPIFVDIRFRRAVRAEGFKEKAFENELGSERYHWMKSLGNANIGGTESGVRISDPESVGALLDLAVAEENNNRRIIFFCSCDPLFAGCHRHTVGKLLLKEAKKRGVPLKIEAWPGGDLTNQPVETVKLTNKEMVTHVLAGNNFPVNYEFVKDHLNWPWGTLVWLDSDTEHKLVAVGPPSIRAEKWYIPIYLMDDSSETASLIDAVSKCLKKQNVLPLSNKELE
jgi:hypothetical protein